MEGQDGPASSCLFIIQSAVSKEGLQRLGGMIQLEPWPWTNTGCLGKTVREEMGEEFSPV